MKRKPTPKTKPVLVQRRFTLTVVADKRIGKGVLREMIAGRLEDARSVKMVRVAYAPDPVKAKPAPKRKTTNSKTAARKPVRKAAAKRKPATKPATKKPVRKTARKSTAKKPSTTKKKGATKKRKRLPFYVYNRRGERMVA